MSMTYMGPNIKLILLKKAEATLAIAVFDGRSRTVPWTKHVSRIREAFDDMGSFWASAQWGYKGQQVDGFLPNGVIETLVYHSKQ